MDGDSVVSRAKLCCTLGLFVLPALLVAFASGQVTAELSKKLASPDMAERESAFNELTATKPLSEEAKGAVVWLLLREDKLMYDSVKVVRDDPPEGNPVYLGKLTAAVRAIAESDPDQPGVWLALVRSGYGVRSAFADWLAQHREKTTPFLLADASDPEYSEAFDVLARISRYERDPAAEHKLQPHELEVVELAVRSAIRGKGTAVFRVAGDRSTRNYGYRGRSFGSG